MELSIESRIELLPEGAVYLCAEVNGVKKLYLGDSLLEAVQKFSEDRNEV